MTTSIIAFRGATLRCSTLRWAPWLRRGAATARADDYPSRPVKIIAPFGAGGPTDVYTRDISDELRKSLHQTFFIENRPGAGTTIGTDLVAKADPDGYTLLMVSSTQTVNETLYPDKPYQLLRDLVPLAPLMENDLVLVVPPSLPVKNLSELLALARAKPGTLNFGSSGPGSNYHMAAELLKNLTGIDIVHVPYKGSTGMRTDILSGQIQMLFELDPHHGTAGQGRNGARARHHRHDPLADPARRADNCRSRRSRLSIQPMGRLHGSQRHAAANSRSAQPDDHRNPQPAGHQGGLGAAGRDADGDDASRI